MIEEKCPLCLSKEVGPFHSKVDGNSKKLQYDICMHCKLIYLRAEHHLSDSEEKSRYDLHQNSPDDQGYVKHLNRLVEPLSQRLKEGGKGLDFGCGPGPTISSLLGSKGFDVSNYDLFYFQDDSLLEKQYDFITCTEVIEHFRNPRKEFERLNHLLKEGRVLGIMTNMFTDEINFASWWYHSEPTHICFYQHQTLEWIADWQGWSVDFPAKDIAIFTKSRVPSTSLSSG